MAGHPAARRQSQERGRYLRKIAFFSFQPSGPPFTLLVAASTVKTLNECKVIAPGQKFIFFRITGTDIRPEPRRASRLVE